MPSLKSRIIIGLLRKRHLFKGKLRKEVFDDNSSIENFRRECEDGAARYAKIPDGITIKEEIIAGIKGEWIIPVGANEDKLIMYVHGGGYVSGSCSDHRGFVSKFAKRCGVINYLYEYRLAPEHPFPAAVDDSVTIYEELLNMGKNAENIIIAGESAGGGLVLSILLALKEKKISLPKAAVAISPWTDLTCSSPSYTTKNSVSLAPLNSWLVFSKHYIGNNKADNPLISPLFGDLAGLPPIYINSGEDDELFDDGERFYLKAKQAGNDVTFRAGKGMIHCYPLLDPMFKEATEAMDEICGFIKKHLKLETQ
ncbi:MAG: alpha/beta hydrolase [Ignavibacteria bacterium]|jgi:acetyl esterase/lipase|nr:alpha/beta hydrolase [Ignavibacteria bacterium]